MPINLGNAVFGLGINAGNFVAGMTSAGAALSGFAAKNSKGMAESVKAYQAFSAESDKVVGEVQKHKTEVDKLTQTISANAAALKAAEGTYEQQVDSIDALTLAIKQQKESISILTKTRATWVNDKSVQLSQTTYKQSLEQINALIVKQKEDIDRLTTSRAKLKEGAKQGFIAAGMNPTDAGRASTDAFNANLTLRKNKLKELLDAQKEQTKFIQNESVQAYKAEVDAQKLSLEQLQINATAQRSISVQRHEEYSKLMIDMENYNSQLRVEQIRLNQAQQQQRNLGTAPATPTKAMFDKAAFHDYHVKFSEATEQAAQMVANGTKGFERMTRGLRGMTTEWAGQKEKVYQAEAAITSYYARVDQAKVAVEGFSTKFDILADAQIKRTAQINENRSLEVRRIAEIAREQERLNKMIADGKPVAAITAQTAKIGGMESSLRRLSAETEVLVAREKDDVSVKKQLEAQYDTALAYYQKLKEGEEGYRVALDKAKEAVDQVIQKQQQRREKAKADQEAKQEREKAKEIRAAAAEVDKQKDKVSLLSKAWTGMVGLFKEYLRYLNPIKPKIEEINGATQRLHASSVNVTAVFDKLQMTMATMAGSAIGTVLGNIASQLGGVSANALEVYKSNELMQQSLTSMLSAQMVNAGLAKDTGAAHAQAAVAAKELDAWMKKLAIDSPFSQNDVKDGMQLGLALGFNTEQAKRLTKATIDWAAASGRSGEEMTQVTRAMGQMNANGKVTLEDLNQLTNVGIGWSSVLEKEFAPEIAKSGKSLRDLISEGIVPADRAIGALTASFETDFKDGAKNAGQTITGLLASLGDIKDSALAAGWTGLIEALKPLLVMFTDFFVNGNAIDKIREFGTLLGGYVTQAVNAVIAVLPTLLSMWNDLQPVIGEAISGLAEFARFAYDWGAGLIQEFSSGIMDNIQPIIDAISWIGSLFTEWLMPHSPPKILPDIDKWGQETIQLWADGMSKPDMSAIADIGDTVRGILSSSGSDESIASAVIGSQEAMAGAISEFKKWGSVSDVTFTKIRSAAGSAGDKVEAYARAMFASQAATKRVTDAQNALNAVTTKYDAILKPLNDRLAAFQNKQAGKAITDEIKSLQEQLSFANPEGMDFDKSGILARLEELDIQKQINEAESARDKELNKAQDVLTIAEKEADKKQTELDLIKEQIDFGNRKNDMLREQTQELEKQAELAERASKASDQATDDTDKLADAQFRASLAQATSAEKIELLQQRLSELSPDTVEYIKVQQELAKAQDEYNKELNKTADAEFDLNLARGSAAEQIQMLQDRLNTLTPGTLEYIKVQKQLEKVQLANEEAANKLTDAEFAAALAGEDRAGKIELLKKQLSGMEEGSLEYLKTQKKLNALELAEEKAQEKKLGGGKDGKPKGGMLTGKPFAGLSESAKDAQKPIQELSNTVAGVSKAAQSNVVVLRSFFDQVRKYSSEFGYILSRIAMGFAAFLVIEKALKPLLTFLFSIKDLLTPINLLALALLVVGTILRENIGGIQEILAKAFKDVMPVVERIKNTVETIAKAFESGNFNTILSTLQNMIPQLLQDFSLIGGRLAAAIQEWAAPFIASATAFLQTGLTLAITAFSTWVSSGGIDGIWASIQGGFNNGFEGVGKWMQTVGFEYLVGGWNLLMLTLTDQIKKNIPGFNDKLVEIGVLLTQGMAALVAYAFPYFVQILEGLGGMIKAWVDAGGITNIVAAMSAVFAQYGPGIIAGIGLLVAMAGTAIVESVPILIAKFQEWSKLAVKWMLNEFPTIMSSLGAVVGGLLAGLGKIIIASVPGLLKAFLELVNRIATAIPGIVKFLTSAIATFATWLLTDGIVEIVKALAGILVVILNWIGTTAPTLMYNIGNMLGDTLIKLLGAVVAIIAYWVTQTIPLLTNAFTWIQTDLFPAIMTQFNGVKDAGMAFMFGWITGILSPFADLARTITSDFVTNILTSLGISLDAGSMEFVKKWVGLFDLVVSKVKEFLGIASPSKVFLEIGEQVVQGSIDGVTGTIQNLIDLLSTSWNTIYTDVTTCVTNMVTEGTTKWEKFKKDFTDAADDLKRLIPIAIAVMQAKVVAAIRTLVEDGWAKVKQFRDDITTAFDEVSTRVTGAMSAARDTIGTVLEELVGKVGTAFENLKKFFSDKNFRDGVLADAKNIGSAIIDGVIAGFRGGFETLKNALLSFLKETVGKMLDEWKENFFGSYKPDPPKASGGNGTQKASNSSGPDSIMAGEGGMTATSYGDRGGTQTTPGATTAAPPKWNWRMVAALWDASKNKKALPRGLGTPTKYDLAEFVRQGGKLNRGFVAAMNNPVRYSMAGSGRTGDPWRIEERLDLDKRWKEIEELGGVNTNPTPTTSAMMGDTTNSGDTITNNYNATFKTERDSTGLMNDFLIMKTLRRT